MAKTKTFNTNQNKLSEIIKLSKRINQRLLRAERNDLTETRGYENIKHFLNNNKEYTSSGKGNRFKENYKTLNKNDEKFLLGYLRQFDSMSDYHGKSALEHKKLIDNTYDKFTQHFKDNKGNATFTRQDLSDYMTLMKAQTDIQNIIKMLPSDTVMDITQQRRKKGITRDIESDIRLYISINGSTNINVSKLVSFLNK